MPALFCAFSTNTKFWTSRSIIHVLSGTFVNTRYGIIFVGENIRYCSNSVVISAEY